jgi:cytochrome c553
MKALRKFALLALLSGSLIAAMVLKAERNSTKPAPFDHTVNSSAKQLVADGRQIFRFDTFGDEDFWGGTLHLHKAIEGASFGGVGPGVSPATAAAVGLKIDVDALPESVVSAIQAGQVNLNAPAVTLALLKLNAVVGLTGVFNQDGSLKTVGIQCSLCHSRVDNSFSAPGIPEGVVGHRLDGWSNQDLNVGQIIALAPNLEPVAKLLSTDVATVRKVLMSWGPGKFDAELFLDGKAFQPNGRSAATLIPPAFGKAGVNLHTWTGDWGTVSYWNAFVANLEMHGKGNFFDTRLDNARQFPVAAANRLGHVHNDVDLISPKLPALHFYQLAIPAPEPPKGSFDEDAAKRGDELFSGKAKCATCHTEPTGTEPGWNLHKGSEVCIDNFQADRAPNHRYRTTPLAGLWTHTQRGFFHDGRFPSLLDVVNHYDSCFSLGLSSDEKRDLVEYLKSLPAEEGD